MLPIMPKNEQQKKTLDQILLQKQQQIKDNNSTESQQIIDVNEKEVKLVIFSLSNEWYAFYGDRISEILPEDTTIFFVPGCPKSLTGVINVRGEIESVINISTLLKLSNNDQDSPQNIVLLAKSSKMSSGISVNKVIDVVDVPQRIIQAPPETLPAHLRAYVLDILEFRGQAVTVLNLEQIFSDYQQGLEV